jgi:hypothetical protein
MEALGPSGDPAGLRKEGISMSIVIPVAAKDKARAWGLLVRHSPGTALPDRTFIVSEVALRALRAAGVKFEEISREPGQAWSGDNGRLP